MTTTDQPAEGQLTRRQLREIRMTGATPIVSAEQAAESAAKAADHPVSEPQAEPTPQASVNAAIAEPASEPAPRTRRQAREQGRTGGIPVVDASTHVASSQDAPAVSASVEPVTPIFEHPSPVNATEPSVAFAEDAKELFGEPGYARSETNSDALPAFPAPEVDSVATAGEAIASVFADAPAQASSAPDPVYPVFQQDATLAASVEPEPAFSFPPADGDVPILRPSAGSDAQTIESFDELLSRSSTSTGSTGSLNALILSESETLPPLTSPVTSTGQIILTGTLALPDTLGSQGHAPGVTDGKDVDNVLLDREIPAQSSPTPIAATAAVSQAKQPVEMIRPPVPEKKNTLATTIAIVAGVLALAGIGFIIYAVSTGLFQ